MPINITFGDFDTVCYSNQHNIIELIKHSVGLSIEVNINASNINKVQDEVKDVAQEAHDAYLLTVNLNQRMSAVEFNVDAILENSLIFKSSALGERIKKIEDRLDALE